MKNENTNQIIKTVAKILNVTLEDNHISTSHRLIKTGNNSSTAQQSRTNADLQHPSIIIVRFSNRDKRNKIFRRQSFLRDSAEVKACFAFQNIALRENLTDYRNMFNEPAHQAKHDLKYTFLWTSQGRIKLRREEKSEVIHVSLLSVLKKTWFFVLC